MSSTEHTHGGEGFAVPGTMRGWYSASYRVRIIRRCVGMATSSGYAPPGRFCGTLALQITRRRVRKSFLLGNGFVSKSCVQG